MRKKKDWTKAKRMNKGEDAFSFFPHFSEGKLQYLEKRQKSLKASYSSLFFCFFFLFGVGFQFLTVARLLFFASFVFTTVIGFIYCALHMCASVCLHFLVCVSSGTTCVRFAIRNCLQKCKNRENIRKSRERCTVFRLPHSCVRKNSTQCLLCKCKNGLHFVNRTFRFIHKF